MVSILIINTLFLWTSTTGELVLEKDPVCSNGTAVYRCTNSNENFFNWVFVTMSGAAMEVFSFNILTPEGTVSNAVVGSSPVIFNVTASNVSFISVTATIPNPVSLGGTTMICDGHTLQLPTHNSSSFFPNQLTLVFNSHYNGTFDFTITWLPIDQVNSEYLITVSPSSLYHPNKTRNSSALSVSFKSNIQYDITISWSECPDSINTTYTIGGCPFLLDTPTLSVLQYNIDISGILSVQIRCNVEYGNESHVIECGRNQQWYNSTTAYCTNTTQIQREKDHSMTTENGSITTSTVDEDGIVCATIGISVLIFAGSIIGSNLFVFITGTFFGLLCGIKYMQKNTNKTVSRQTTLLTEEVKINSIKGPIYDEIKLNNNNSTDIDVSRNIAYEHTMMKL